MGQDITGSLFLSLAKVLGWRAVLGWREVLIRGERDQNRSREGQNRSLNETCEDSSIVLLTDGTYFGPHGTYFGPSPP